MPSVEPARPFRDRAHAGRRLAERLLLYRHARPIVVALPRGGVVVAAEVARALGAPLDLLVARKLASPEHPEFGVGAIAPGGVLIVDEASADRAGLDAPELEGVIERERAEMDRRLRHYRGDAPAPDLVNRLVLLVDDGIATGVTARAAIRSLRKARARAVVMAVPVAPRDAVDALSGEVDELVVLHAPEPFGAVGLWYEHFEPTEDAEVLNLLADFPRPPGLQGGDDGAPVEAA